MPTLQGPAVTALSPSELEKDLAGLNQRMIELEAKLDHVLNNQHAVAEANARLMIEHLSEIYLLLNYACSKLGPDNYHVRSGFAAPTDVLRRVGDRLVSTLDYYLPGEVAFGSITDDGTVWALTDDDSVLRWDRAGAGWTVMPGKLRWLFPGRLRRIAILSQNELIGVSANEQIWRWNGSDWTALDGQACDVTIGPGQPPALYCINRTGLLYERSADRWSQIPGGCHRLVIAGRFRLEQFGRRLMVRER